MIVKLQYEHHFENRTYVDEICRKSSDNLGIIGVQTTILFHQLLQCGQECKYSQVCKIVLRSGVLNLAKNANFEYLIHHLGEWFDYQERMSVNSRIHSSVFSFNKPSTESIVTCINLKFVNPYIFTTWTLYLYL